MFVRTATSESVALNEIQKANPGVSFPLDPSDEALTPFGYARINPTEPPPGDVVTQGPPEHRDGVWYQTWEVREFTAEELTEREQQQREQLSQQVDDERDRRISAGFVFQGTLYQTARQTDRENILGAAPSALAAIVNGAQPGDLRWADAAADFFWIAADNSRTPMDAQTTLAFSQGAMAYKTSLIVAGSNLKAMNPIPENCTDDQWWPPIDAQTP